MKRILETLLASAALAMLVHVNPASACDAQQKTTMANSEKAQPEKAAKSKQNTKESKAQQKDESGAQAKSVASARVEQK